MESFYSNNNFDVVINEERGIHDMKNYGVMNKITGVIEHYSPYLAEAVAVANNLDEKMAEAFEDKASASDEDGNVVNITEA